MSNLWTRSPVVQLSIMQWVQGPEINFFRLNLCFIMLAFFVFISASTKDLLYFSI